MRRFLLASAFSLLYLVVLAVFLTQGKIDRDTLLAACAIVGGLIVAFYAVFRTNANLKFRDPRIGAGTWKAPS